MSPSRHGNGLGPSTSALDARLGASRHRPGTLSFLSSKGLVWSILDDPEYCDWRSPPRSVAYQVIRAISSPLRWAWIFLLPLAAWHAAFRTRRPPSFQFPCLVRCRVRCTVVRAPAGVPLFPFIDVISGLLRCSMRMGIYSGHFSALIRPQRRRSLKNLCRSVGFLARGPSRTILVQTRVGHIRGNAHPPQSQNRARRGTR